jgi:RNA polymerase sigma factor (sigma-70 family)
MLKCAHGVYIPSRTKNVVTSDGCSICMSQAPWIDRRFGIETTKAKLPVTMSSLYEFWLKTEDIRAYDKLFKLIRNFARYVAKKKFAGDYSIPDYGDAANDAAISCMMDLPKYGGGGRAFSSWVHKCISRDLMDWVTREVHKGILSLDNAAHPIMIQDQSAGVDEKLLLKEVKSLLSTDELQLFQKKGDGMTIREIAEDMGRGVMTVQDKWKKVEEKIKVITG